MQIAILAVLVCVLLCVLALLVLVGVLFWLIRKALTAMTTAAVGLSVAVEGLPSIADGMGDLKEMVRSVPSLLLGLTDVTKEQVAVMVANKRLNARMQSLMFGTKADDASDALEAEADILMEENSKMGIDEARERAAAGRRLKGFQVG